MGVKLASRPPVSGECEWDDILCNWVPFKWSKFPERQEGIASDQKSKSPINQIMIIADRDFLFRPEVFQNQQHMIFCSGSVYFRKPISRQLVRETSIIAQITTDVATIKSLHFGTLLVIIDEV